MTAIFFNPSTWSLLIFSGLIPAFIGKTISATSMLSVPTLLCLDLAAHLTLGTHKLCAFFSSVTACYVYFIKQLFSPTFWRKSVYSTLVALLIASIFVNLIDTQWLEKILLVIILAVAIYTLLNRIQDIDNQKTPEKRPALHVKKTIQSFLLGFYDSTSGLTTNTNTGTGTGEFWPFPTSSFIK